MAAVVLLFCWLVSEDDVLTDALELLPALLAKTEK